MKPISKEFCSRDALVVAKELLGKVIEFEGSSGMIVETEAYKNDPASHGYTLTPRSEIMFRTHGRWYVYFIYGMYHCLNITTNKDGVGAVLIRALEPLKGIEQMKNRRKTDKLKNLMSGPGKLCQALGITKEHNDAPIHRNLRLLDHKTISKTNIIATKRIGISEGKDLNWRFFVKGNKHISKGGES